MTALRIVTGKDNPILRAPCRRVAKVTKSVAKLIKDMRDTLDDAKGAGLAAPQVGSDVRVCLTVVGGRDGGRVIALINPEIIWKDVDMVMGEEGCLSLPNVWLQVPRHREIVVTYMDEDGKTQERRLKNFDARVVQHETDHLNGILITDYQETRASIL